VADVKRLKKPFPSFLSTSNVASNIGPFLAFALKDHTLSSLPPK